MIGAKLPNGVEIKQAALRGVESHGMLCSAKELGIDADASGLMELPADAPVGEALAKYLGLPDATHRTQADAEPSGLPQRARPRARCRGAVRLGVPRAGNQGRADAVAQHGERFAWMPARTVRDISAALIEGIDPAAKTPLWLAERLRRSGLRPISAVVDVTNYVMIELGQPLHAFDNSKLSGDIVVRRARAGESLKLLDGSEHALEREIPRHRR